MLPKYHVKFLDCCLLGQLGQDHREGSNSDEITVFPLPGRYHLNRLTIKTTTTTNMMVHYHELECHAKKKTGFLPFRSRSQWGFKSSKYEYSVPAELLDFPPSNQTQFFLINRPNKKRSFASHVIHWCDRQWYTSQFCLLTDCNR